ncbi:MAG: [LysW]-aminoadipate kinase [Gammaproteobacteria bacterium]|nr:[LysW]-aminoadipate kinase [Gammaproteobacteria bacterium]
MIIVKIGGGDSLNLAGIIADLADVEGPVVIIHGANALRDRIAARMGFEKRVLTSVSGYSSVFSDDDALDAILMAYAGLRNKRIVELCQQRGINAVGLTGLDGRVIQGQRNKGIRVRDDGRNLIKRDLSGKPKQVNAGLLALLLDNGYTPVLTIPIADENAVAINSENDDIVCLLQETLSADTVLQLIEAPGFMDDVDDPATLHETLGRDELDAMEAKTTGRIKRKLHALNKLVRGDVEKVIICDGRVEHPVRDGLAGAGTWIR